MPTHKDKAVCLRLVDWSETSQIAVLLTREHGKVTAVAKGAKRRTPSTLEKFSGGLELATVGEGVWIAKGGSQLDVLTEWDLIDACWPLRQSLRAYQLAMYAIDLVHHLLHDDDPHPQTFHSLEALLQQLGDSVGREPALMQFQWAVISDAGFKPVLERDVQTQQPLPEGARTYAFSAQAGGLVADTGGADRWRVRGRTVALLRQVAGGESPGEATDADLGRANQLLCAYARSILDRHLPTMDALLPRPGGGRST